jgi:hypothetical protein
MAAPQIYHPTDWSRAGRGRELQFFATDRELLTWFDALPDENAPYTIWGSRLVRRDIEHERVLFRYSLEEWTHALAAGWPDQFFLHAAKLISPLPVDEEAAPRANEWGSLNGLVLVQHGSTRAGKRLASRIAVTDKIRNRSSGKTVSIKERALVFDALRTMIETDLCFTSIQVFRDGHEEEDNVQLMTAEAAQLAAEGYFIRRPGRRIKR